MRDGWVENTLEEISEVIMGQSPEGKTYNLNNIGLPFMQGSAEFGVHHPIPQKWCSEPKKIAKPGDLLLSVRAPVGDTNFADQELAIGRGLSVIRANDKSITKFIRLAIQLNVADLIASSGSGMFSSITGKNLREFKISVPPLTEQKRIVDLISSVDSYIEALQQQVDKARKSRNAVLHELLTKGGDGWVETTLGEVAQFFNGKAYSKEELLSQGKYRVLRVGNFFSNNSWYWSDLELESEKYCEEGDLLYAWSASFGPRIWKEEKVIYHYHIWKIMENPNLILKTWLFYWLDNDVEEMKSAAGTGSIMMHITKGEIEKRKIMLPSIEIQKVQIGVLQSFDATIQAQEATFKNMLNLRSALLSDLLSGNHEIPTTYDKLIGAA